MTGERPLEPARVEAIIASTFPLPIAVAFVQDPTSALDATLRHLGIVCANDALAGTVITRARTELIHALGELKRPIAPARWLDVLRFSLRALDQEMRRPLIPGIDAWFRARERSLEEALELKRRARVAELEAKIVEILGSLGCLRSIRLAWVDNTTEKKRGHLALVLWLDGVQSASGSIELSQAVESDLVYAICPGTRTLLSLDPLYRVIRCSECSEMHLFQLLERGYGKLRYEAIGTGHRVTTEDRPPSMRRFLRGHRGRRQMERLAIPMEPTRPALDRGDVVSGRWRIQRFLKQGALGPMFVATDQSTHRSIALEIVPHRLISDPALVERIRSEVGVAHTIQHPHLVPILDYHQTRGDHHLALELPNGWPKPDGHAIDVSQLPRPVAPELVASIGRQALEGLAFLHGRGIVHGGVTPKSLLLFGGGIVKVSDYAFPRARAAILRNATGLSSEPKYLAPEQERVDGVADARSDVYAVAAVLRELLDPKTVPPWLALSITRALEKDPSRRYQSAPAFREALDPRAQERLKGGEVEARLEIVETRVPGVREGDRIFVPKDRAFTLGDQRATVAIGGLSGTAAVIEWLEAQRVFTIRHDGSRPSIPIETTVDGQLLPPFEDSPPRVLHDGSTIVVQMLGRPLLTCTFRLEVRPPPRRISNRFVKFRCGRCGAMYQVSREKVRVRPMRARCKKCSSEIMIRGRE